MLGYADPHPKDLTTMARPTRLELFTRALWVAMVPGAVLFCAMQVAVHVTHGMVGADSHAYWVAAGSPDTWYTTPPDHVDAYLYSPAFAQLLWPLGFLPWPVFQGLWLAAQVTVLAWLLKPLGLRRGLTVAPFFVAELLLGNVYVFLAAALVLAVGSKPGALVVPLLTKVTPAVVGLWFVVRGDWRAVRAATLAAVVVVGASAAIDPQAWPRWIEFLAASAGTGGPWFLVRFAVATVLVVWAARTGRAWLLAPALLLACPVFSAFSPYSVLGAVPRLLRWERAQAEELRAEQQEAVVAGSDRPATIPL